MYYYAITIRKLSNPKPEDYTEYLNAIDHKFPQAHVEVHYEVTPKSNGNHNVHMHGVIKTPHYLPFKAFNQIFPKKGWSTDIQKMYSVGWKAYITKQNLLTIKDVNTHLAALNKVKFVKHLNAVSPPSPTMVPTKNLFLRYK